MAHKDSVIPYVWGNFPSEANHPGITIDKVVKSGCTMDGLVTTEDIPAGTLLYAAQLPKLPDRTIYTIQVGTNDHVVSPFIAKLNHGCDPTTVIRAEQINGSYQFGVIARKDLTRGSEVTFRYPTTEMEVTPGLTEIRCGCGADNCQGEIVGFDDLSKEVQQQLVTDHLVVNYIRELIMARVLT